MKAKKNRWLIALSAVGLHISIGSIYAWSNFTTPLQEKFGWSSSEIAMTFSIAILFLGLSAAFLGHFVEKHGPKKAGLLAALFFGLGITGSGFAVHLESKYLLYLFYGVLGGTGLGLGYVAPVSTLIKWFPDRRGLATGLAIMGFGFAAAISSPVMNALIESVGIAKTFYILGISYFTIMVLSSLYLARPEEGWLPEGFKAKMASGKARTDLSQLMANEAVKTKRFWYLWFMILINITCGIAILSVAKPLAMESIGISMTAAAALVGALGVFNGLGRVGWATLSDYIGRSNAYITFFILQIIAFFVLPHISVQWLFMGVLIIIYTCYGGGFSALPAFIGDLFGTKQLGAIHGYILTAWATAGVVGPSIAAWIKDTTGSYTGSLTFFSGLFIVALIISLLMKADIKKLKAAQTTHNK